MATFESLPVEIQQMVFEELRYVYLEGFEPQFADPSDLLEFALVSKNWNRVFQRSIYSYLKLDSYSQITRLNKSLKQFQNLSNLITRIKIEFLIVGASLHEFLAFEELFTLVPNLEYINCARNWSFYYPLLMNALLANQLPHLNDMEPADFFKDRSLYATCAILIKDKLKTLAISDMMSDDYTPLEEMQDWLNDDDQYDRKEKKFPINFYFLFDKLDQFKRITELRLSKETDDVIDLLEKVTNNCPTVQKLYLETASCESKTVNKVNVHNAVISNYLPAPNVSYLDLRDVGVLHDSQLMHYIVKKFPRLNTLGIFSNTIQPGLDQHVLDLFLDYLTRIKYVRLMYVPYYDEQKFVDSAGAFWRALSQSQVLSVIFEYLDTVEDNSLGRMRINIKDGKSMIYITDRSCISLKNSTLFQTYGRYIDELGYSSINSEKNNSSQKAKIEFGRIIQHSLKFCVNLKQWSIYHSDLDISDFVDHEAYNEKYILNSVRIRYCNIGSQAVLEKVTSFFTRINYLEVKIIDACKTVELENCTVELNMMDTDFRTLSLFVHYSGSHIISFLVRVLTQEKSTYFLYDRSSMNNQLYVPVTEDEYHSHSLSGNCFLVATRCKSLKYLKLNYSDEEASLTFDI